MTTRAYALLLLATIALAPLLALGYLTSRRAEQTATAEVQTGADRLAQVIGERMGAYVSSERKLLASLGAAALQARTPADAQALLEASQLDYPYLRAMSVHGKDGARVAGHDDPARVELARRAFRLGRSLPMHVVPADRDRGGGFSHTTTWVEPVVVVGEPVGVIVSLVDLVGVWPPINGVQLGKTGFVRLLAGDGTLLAHGDPEERRFVFADDSAGTIQLVDADGRVTNRQGQHLVTASAAVPGTDWSVIVEQSVSEALRGTALMKRDLTILAAIAVVVVILLGVMLGRVLVRELERLQAHARLLAQGDLDLRLEPTTRIAEVRALTIAMNDMAASLALMQNEALARDRMATFARVAAGLAHDLRQPIETVRAVCAQLSANPDDEPTRARFDKITARDLPRLGDYVGDLQRMARGDQLAVRLESVDPGALAAQVVDDLSGTPKWRGVEFTTDGDAAPVPMDRRLVYRALVNLASNGADACVQQADAGCVRIEVRDARNENAVELRVHDTGVGIPADRVSRVIEGDFETTKRSTGIGLGLGIVRHVALVHGGQLRVDSTVGQGSVFSLLIPVRDRGAGSAPP